MLEEVVGAAGAVLYGGMCESIWVGGKVVEWLVPGAVRAAGLHFWRQYS